MRTNLKLKNNIIEIKNFAKSPAKEESHMPFKYVKNHKTKAREENIISFHKQNAYPFLKTAFDKEKAHLYQDAIENYTKAINLLEETDNKKTIREQMEALNNRGHLYYIQKDYENALHDFNKAIDINPKFAPSFANRGQVYFKIKKYDQAGRDFEKAIELGPRNPYYYHIQGHLFTKTQNYEKALRDYEKAIELDPYDEYSYLYRGNLLLLTENFTQALIDFNRYVEMNPKDEKGYIQRAVVLTHLLEFKAAVADLKQAIKICPTNKLAYFNLANIQFKHTNNAKEALKNYNKHLTLDPLDIDAYINRGNCYLKLEKFKEAEKDFNKAINLCK